MRTGTQYILAFLIRHDSTDRNAAAESFCHADDVRLNAVLLIAEQASGTSDARLNLVNQKQDVLLLADLGSCLYKFLIKRKDAALALNHLHHDSAGRIINLALHVFDIIGCRIIKSFREWEEILMELVLSGCL